MMTEIKPSLQDLTFYFLKLGTIGFGGPIALVSAMQRDLVDKSKWYTQEMFKEGMTLSQMAPGPLATQLAIYLGWARHGVWGATVVGIAFVIPSFIMVVLLAILYMQYGSLPLIQKLFSGIGPAVIAIICIGAHKLSKKNLKTDWALWLIAILNAIAVALTESEIVWLFLLSGFLYMALSLKKTNMNLFALFPPFLFTGLANSSDNDTLKTIFLFFLKAGAFVFGSGLAIVPFLHGGVVVEHQWLTEAQFLDAVAIAMITPGPVVITVSFIGYLVAGFAGASVAAIATFLPCYFFTILPAPYFSKISKNKNMIKFIDGITAAAIGAILGATIILAKKSLIDTRTILIFSITLLGLLYLKKIPEPLWIVLAGVAGCMI